MKKLAYLCLGLLCSAAFGVRAQGMPLPPPPRDATLEQREQWRDERREERREERRQQHEAWQQMSPAERQQLRQDIRDSGRALYPRQQRHRRPD